MRAKCVTACGKTAGRGRTWKCARGYLKKAVERNRVKAGKSTGKAARIVRAREHLMKKWKMPDVHFTERYGDNVQIEKVLIGQKE